MLMKVTLTEELDRYVRDQLATGLYSDVSEVIREALRLKTRTDEAERAKLEALRQEIDTGWQQAEDGAFEPYRLESLLRVLDEEASGASPR